MLNTGDTTWSESNFYRLASVAPRDPFGSRVALGAGEQVLPNQSKTFSFTSRAPFAGGTYLYHWQMVEDFVQFFGSTTTPVAVTVTPPTTLFFTLTPCRVLDTRNPVGPYGGPEIAANSGRVVTLWGQCGIPNSAKSIAVNLTVVSPAASGNLTVYPPNIVTPNVSTLNFSAGVTRANNAVVTVDTDGRIEIYSAGAAAHVVLDVTGYFE
jgi:hypothetical protein